MHLIAVSHNQLDSSKHAVDASNLIHHAGRAITVASHATHKKTKIFNECTYDPLTGYISHYYG